MARYKMFIEYDGSRYSGWQVQLDSRTIQGELIDTARRIFDTTDLEIYGSGRTDAGVHALAQVAHLEVTTGMTPDVIQLKMNDKLPHDIHILKVEKAAPDFHARYNAVARSYLYQISRRRTAFGKRFVWWIKDPLDFELMRQTSQSFLGMKNFQSFMDQRSPDDQSSKVQIETIQMAEDGDLILIRLVGSHFLWKMVRRVVGILVEVGRGRMTPEQVQTFLRQKSNEPSRFTAPPSGLFLEKVYYGQDERLVHLRPFIYID